MKKKKLIIGIIAGVLVLALGVYMIVNLIYTFRYDTKLIATNPNYNVVAGVKDGYTTIRKVDGNGNTVEGDFKILAFTDTHLDTYLKKGEYTMNLMISNIVREKPDFVIFVGDNVTGGMERFRTYKFANVMEKLGVYWTCVLGNHEGDDVSSQKDSRRQKMLEIFSRYDHCLVDAETKYLSDGTVVDGYGNHVINVLGKDDKVVHSLYMLDGGYDMSEQDLIKYNVDSDSCKEYDYIKQSQILWYEQTVNDIKAQNNNQQVTSSVYVHIPLPEFEIAYNDYTGQTEADLYSNPTCNVPTQEGTNLIYGARREEICCSGHNSGMFDKIVELGSTKYVISGHDHVNNFVMNYNGITLAYCQKSGYSSYNVHKKSVKENSKDSTKPILNEQDMLEGYSVYTVKSDGSMTLATYHNCDIAENASLLKDVIKYCGQ